MRGLITALRTLTRIPGPGRDCEVFADALPFFPWVGALLGGLTVGVFLTVSLILPYALVAAASAVLCLAWLTRGLHLDGLADTADALGGGCSIERRLAIMKDPHVGAFGVITLVGVLLLKTAILFEIGLILFGPGRLSGRLLLGLIIPFIVSRTVQVWLCTALPYARVTGGTAGPFVAGAQWTHLAGALAGALLLCAVIHPLAGAVLLAGGLLLGVGLRRYFRAQFGGITGDLLGASNEIVETAALLLYAILLTHVPL